MTLPPSKTSRALATEAGLLGAEAAAVLGLRSARLLRGGKGARDEAALMVREKLAASCQLTGLLLTGKLGLRPDRVLLGMLRFYRKGVRANRRRLARGG